MPNNIVILGPPDSGKSTIAGCLKAKRNGAAWFRKSLLDIQKTLGNRYCYADKYALLVDTHADERRRRLETTHGKSQYMHPVRAGFGNLDVLLIDTPGTERYDREQFRGLYYGDIAVLVVEISQFAKGDSEADRTKRLYADFKGLIYWLGLAKQRGGMVVVISKMDTVEFSESVFNEAAGLTKMIIETMIQSYRPSDAEKLPITVIPLSIEISAGIELNSDSAHNLEEPSERLSWFTGPTLNSSIKTLLTAETPAEVQRSTDAFLMCVRGRHSVTHAKPVGTILTGKVISGSVSKDDPLKIVPIEYENRWGSIDVTCSEIRYEQSEDSVERATAGEMISVNLTRPTFQARKARGPFTVPSSAIVVSRDARCFLGKILEFSVHSGNSIVFSACESVQILWYGRAITASVVMCDSRAKKLFVELLAAPAAIVDDESVAPSSRSFVLRPTSRTPGDADWFEFIEVRLVTILSVHELIYKCPPDFLFCSKAIGNAEVSIKHSAGLPSEVRVEGVKSYEKTIRAILKAESAQGHKSLDIFSRLELRCGNAERC